jgi:hypothetical protein
MTKKDVALDEQAQPSHGRERSLALLFPYNYVVSAQRYNPLPLSSAAVASKRHHNLAKFVKIEFIF